MYRDLFTQQVYGLSKANPLFSVPVKIARKPARPARATLITGSLYSALVQYAGAQEEEPGWSENIKDTMLALNQVSVGPPFGAVEALDYIVYFLIALCQGYNNDYNEDENGEGMEELRLSQMSQEPYQLAMEARKNWIDHRVKPLDVPESKAESSKGSPTIQADRRTERSPSHGRGVSTPSRNHHSEPRH